MGFFLLVLDSTICETSAALIPAAHSGLAEVELGIADTDDITTGEMSALFHPFTVYPGAVPTIKIDNGPTPPFFFYQGMASRRHGVGDNDRIVVTASNAYHLALQGDLSSRVPT